MSHPVWVRGLKQTLPKILLVFWQSHPVWVRGLKLVEKKKKHYKRKRSHPVWVRGLKLISILALSHAIEVAPRVGAWIETVSFNYEPIGSVVAPRVGAWIETPIPFSFVNIII